MKEPFLESTIHTPKKSNFSINSRQINVNIDSENDLDNEIKSYLEGKTDESFSENSINSNEEINDEALNHYTELKYWKYNPDEFKENDSPKSSKWTKEDKDSGYKTEQTKSSNKQSTQSNEEDNSINCENNNKIEKNENDINKKEFIIKEKNSNKYNLQNLKMMNNTIESNYNIMGNNFIGNGIRYYQSSFPFQHIYSFIPNYNCLYSKLNEQQNLYQQMNNFNSKIQTNSAYPKLNLNMMFNPNIQQQQILNTKNVDNNNICAKNENKSNSNDKITKNNSNSVNKDNNNKIKNEQKNKNNKTKKNNTPSKVINIQNNKCNNKEKQVLNLDDIVSGKDLRTTIMIRNIPIKYSDELLAEDLSEFKGKYDCLYLPYDYDKNGNKGYAFINFVNPLHILYFYDKFNGKKWSHFESSKICELNSAHFQGINELQKHAKSYKQKGPNFFAKNDENIIIPNKYFAKILKRFPTMKYSENKSKKIFIVKSFE